MTQQTALSAMIHDHAAELRAAMELDGEARLTLLFAAGSSGMVGWWRLQGTGSRRVTVDLGTSRAVAATTVERLVEQGRERIELQRELARAQQQLARAEEANRRAASGAAGALVVLALLMLRAWVSQ